MTTEAESKQLRICILTETFYPPIMGGQERHAYELSQRLAEHGCMPLVITRRIDPASAVREQLGRVTVLRLAPGRILKGVGWSALWPLVQFLVRVTATLIAKRNNYDVILVLGSKVLPTTASVTSVLLGKTWVLRLESSAELWEDISDKSLRKMTSPVSRLLLRYWPRIRRRLINSADHIIAISPEIRQGLLDLGVNSHRLSLISNGINTETFCPVDDDAKRAIKRRLGLPEQRYIINYTGRLAFSKGLPLLMGIWPKTAERYPDAHLLLVGSGRDSYDSCEEELRKDVARYGLEGSVTFAGQVDNAWEYLQASDAFVFPSHYEGCSLAVLEAVACGLPSIVTRTGNAEDVIRDRWNGWLINPNDGIQLSSALDQLLRHRAELAKAGLSSRKVVEERFSIDAVAREYLRRFRELQRGNQHGRGR